MATSKDSLQVHAARLRQLAEHEEGIATVMGPGAMQDLCRSDAKVFLAGAAALEAVEVAKGALRDIANDGVERSRDPRTLRAAAALAKLETL